MPTPRLCKAKINLIDLAGSERTSKAWEHECLTNIDGTKKSPIFSLFYGIANGPFWTILDRFGSASAAFWRHRLSMKGWKRAAPSTSLLIANYPCSWVLFIKEEQLQPVPRSLSQLGLVIKQLGSCWSWLQESDQRDGAHLLNLLCMHNIYIIFISSKHLYAGN